LAPRASSRLSCPSPPSRAAAPAGGRAIAIDASSIIAVEPIDRDRADALLKVLLAAAAARPQGEEPARLQTVYEPARRRLKIVALGSARAGAELLRILDEWRAG
jgi:hypothetical protein